VAPESKFVQKARKRAGPETGDGQIDRG